MKAEFIPVKVGTLRQATLVPALQFACLVTLAIDAGGEAHSAVFGGWPPTGMTILHLSTEFGATVLLGIAIHFSLRSLREMRAALRSATSRFEAMRGEFSALVERRFGEWQLSPSETEVAMLSLKGLTIAEIAAARDSREGTIKAHLSAIFRKAGVRSRTDLLAQFVDDFLDHSAPKETE